MRPQDMESQMSELEANMGVIAHTADTVNSCLSARRGQLEKRATIDRFWNGIQWRLKYKGVIHPACIYYWTYKIFRFRQILALTFLKNFAKFREILIKIKMKSSRP